MAVLTVQRPKTDGVALTKVAASPGGDSFPNTGKEFLNVTNANATAPRTLTIDSPGTCSFGLTNNNVHDQVVIIAALTTKLIGPFSAARFNDPNSRVQVSYSDAAADLTVAVQA
jgi:hypothetical protein